MKRSLVHFGFSVFIVLCSCTVLCAQNAVSGSDNFTKPERQANGGIATMYALDPLARALCFQDGREGLAFQNHRWANRCSDLTFNLAGNGSFVTGVESNRIAAIVDLGTADELRDRYGYEDAASGGEGFASLQFQGDKIVILKEDNPNEALQPLREAPALFTTVGPSANASVRLGHIYLVRIVDKKDPKFQRVVKLMVIAYTPNESVTVRWASL